MTTTDSKPLAIGLDVGWSECRPSCCLAVSGIIPPPELEPRRVTVYGDHLWATVFTLSELVQYLDGVNSLRPHFKNTTLVVDGPLGANGVAPTAIRHVDREFCRGYFNGRFQPSPVVGTSGRTYVDSTQKAVRPFVGNEQNRTGFCWLGGPVPLDGFVYAETNPTVAMALMLEPQELLTLPSRNRPIRTKDRTFSAKSDWYWRLGVAEAVADFFGTPAIEAESHHERVAGLFCLMLARMIANSRGNERIGACAIGGGDGIYSIPQRIHKGWEGDHLRRVGIRGQPDYHTEKVQPLPATRVVLTRVATEPRTSEADEIADRTDNVVLALTDNGGVHVNHNDWMDGLSPPVIIQVPNVGRVDLTPADNGLRSGQWIVKPTTLSIARANGFTGRHLSCENSVEIEAEIVRSAVFGDRA